MMPRHLFRFISVCLCLAVVSACQSVSNKAEFIDPNSLAALTSAQLQPATLAVASSSVVGVEQVIENYTTLLPLLIEPEAKMRVLHRLADLKLVHGETLMAEQAIDELDIAIEAYQGLLQKYPERAINDQVLYQLAKSHDLKGNVDDYLDALDQLILNYPESDLRTEVQFRRGEILFSAGDYQLAESAFNAVIAGGDSAFLANAHYMKGWCLFKQTRYKEGLLSYSAVLDLVMPEDLSVDAVEKKNQTMVEDLFRVMGLSFSYLGGADSIENLFQKTGARPYEILVYDRYSALLLDKEQYSDAIEVYQRFIAIHPLSVWAPRYQINIIDTLGQAGFKQDIVAEKVRFVDEYGLDSVYWQEHKDETLVFVQEQLERLLPELADRHYVLAQRAGKWLNQSKNKAGSERAGKQEARQENYQLAAKYYSAFVATFPAHNLSASTLFLLGECFAQLEQWLAAIQAFEASGYDYLEFEKSAEAAYASVLAYIDYSKTWKQLPAEVFQENSTLQQENRLRFINIHGDDGRAIDVLYVSVQHAFQQKDYEGSVGLSQRLIDWSPAAPAKVLLETHIVKAHSLYALQDYLLAEVAYSESLKLLPAKDKRRKVLTENLAASVYQQAEQRLAAGDKLGAIEEFLRVGLVAPNSSLRPNAEYDAIGYLVELKQWPQAIAEMSAYRSRYPRHALIDTLVPKMALAYRETEQWELAASELKTLIALAKTEQEKQDTLQIVAELYDRAENKQEAILAYRKYANTYPNPPSQYMEAANRLAELYQQTDQPLKRRFWLAKQMKTVDAAPDKADDRMLYLAAGASAVLAEDAFIRYKRIKLALPLNKTMAAKTLALEKAMAAYQKTAAYGVSSYSTQAGYRMADIYAQLSRDLMTSDRPSGLNELELEQYDILLEEQAYPFEENAIDIHEQNASRSWNGIYDNWVKDSFKSLKVLLPGRYDKPELTVEAMDVFE